MRAGRSCGSRCDRRCDLCVCLRSEGGHLIECRFTMDGRDAQDVGRVEVGSATTLDCLMFGILLPVVRCSVRLPVRNRDAEAFSIAHRLNTSLKGVPMVGDSLRDLEAAAAVHALPLLVLTGNGKKTRRAGNLPPGTQTHADLAAAVDALTIKP